jgi:phenylalanyl-tRNA synthetase alpha chain
MKQTELQSYFSEALAALQKVTTTAEVEAWYQAHLAPSGKATGLKRSIGKLPPEERKAFGQAINEHVQKLDKALEERRAELSGRELDLRLRSEGADVSLPPRHRAGGRLHPLTETLRELERVFAEMGFSVYESRHVELDEYNFTLLNMPPDHPARDMQDTLYVSDKVVLRTHTSAGQIRAMRELGPGPIRVILPGLCYRKEDVTARSEMQFHQVEGLMVGENVRLSDLKGVLLRFARRCFGEKQQVRFRGSYFPFTEPSVEVDIQCTLCKALGCRVCKYTGWLELLGAGLVHPTVIANGGYDPEKVRGFAFGMGVERMVMLRHGIDDIRNFYRNDLRFLEQFG